MDLRNPGLSGNAAVSEESCLLAAGGSVSFVEAVTALLRLPSATATVLPAACVWCCTLLRLGAGLEMAVYHNQRGGSEQRMLVCSLSGLPVC